MIREAESICFHKAFTLTFLAIEQIKSTESSVEFDFRSPATVSKDWFFLAAGPAVALYSGLNDMDLILVR